MHIPNGLFNVLVSNGHMTPEAICKMKGLIDAAVVDLKGSGRVGMPKKSMEDTGLYLSHQISL